MAMYKTFRLRRAVFLFLAAFTTFLLFAVPEQCARTLQEGLSLCGGSLLLSLFPFLIVSSLFVRSGAGRMLGVLLQPVAGWIGVRSSGAGGVLLVGLLSGFAPAASAAAESVRTGELSPEQAAALLPACVLSGPSFVILTVGQQMLRSRALGLRLFAAQLGAGYLTASLLNRLGRRAHPVPVSGTPAAAADPPGLDRIVAEAAVTYLKLCGFVLYFRLLAAGCGLLLPGAWQVVPAMLLEVCTGCDYASRTGLAASSLCCAALSVQGASVLLQVRTICPREISLKPLLVGRLLHLPLSLGLFYLGLPEQAVETFSTMSGQVVPLHRVPPDCAVLVFLVICALACRLCPGNGEILPRKQPPEKT